MAILIYYFLLVLIIIPHEADSISFNFSKISPQNEKTDILIMGDASISNDGMQLIPGYKQLARGRGRYVRLLHLWDKTFGELASFSTSFSFVIETESIQDHYSDGLTFFLAEENLVAAYAGGLGLPVDFLERENPEDGYQKALHPFVAVEFDTWVNTGWDPVSTLSNIDDYHVGIDVNSLNSSVFKKWPISITKGAHCQANVTYDSVSNNFSVSVTDDVNGVIDLSYIVDLSKELPEWVIFGFSAGSGSLAEKVTVKSWSFNSSNLRVDEQIKAPPPTLEGPKKGVGLEKVGLIAGVVVISFSVIFIYYLWRRRKHRRQEKMNKDFEQGTGPKSFSYNEIIQATADFAETNKLGEGGFGRVYKGFLKDQKTFIAVKRASKTSQQGIKEYTKEVKIISRLRHRNLVELKGWCHEKRELLLIYEFMENESLDLHLFKQRSCLTWDTRIQIAKGLASALLYLHEGCKECILHRDIKSSNVMLDSSFNVKLGDFGLAKLVNHERSLEGPILVGTFGYMAPEYTSTGKASKESDVYSFGVVALEIACGRKAIEYEAPERPVILVKWVRDLYETGNILKAVDPCLGSDNKEQIERLMIVGLWCAHPLADQRPSMEQAIQVLNYDASLPELRKLPSKMQEITSYVPPNPPPVYYSMFSEIKPSSSNTGSSTSIPLKHPTSSATSSP